MPIKLYELTDDIRMLGEVPEEELEGTAESLNYQFKEKAINIAKFIMELVAEDKAIESEVNRLTDKRHTVINKVYHLKKYIQDNMIQSGIDKIDGTVVKLAIRTNPPSCEVKDVIELPEQFRKLIPQRYEPDRISILKHFKETGEIPQGAEIKTDSKRLEIR